MLASLHENENECKAGAQSAECWQQVLVSAQAEAQPGNHNSESHTCLTKPLLLCQLLPVHILPDGMHGKVSKREMHAAAGDHEPAKPGLVSWEAVF